VSFSLTCHSAPYAAAASSTLCGFSRCSIVSIQPRSQVVTCLISPPMQIALLVGVFRICSSVSP
jgi:hypothetical protein